MSDEEEESMSEGFSASEDEWKPSKKTKGESSDEDDDDSEYEDADVGAGRSDASNKKRDTKGRGVANKAVAKRKKPLGQSLRTKLYNKYRPPPKTISSPNSAGHNSPSASTSRTASKNLRTPNESNNEVLNDSSSDSSVDNYFVKANELDLHSSFFDVHKKMQPIQLTSAAPNDNCFVTGNLSDSGSEDNNDTSGEEKTKAKAFDFRQLLENASSLERIKETIDKRNIQKEANKEVDNSTTAQMDVNALLALGEKQNLNSDSGDKEQKLDIGPSKLSKTKSTRVKRHVKTRPTSTVVGGDTDESDFEEVAGRKRK
ncbi:DNA repair protein complementing XP-C cells homolog [Teleopsis dalmanni]|uniref:DNA repair protein complementing XP-C cells homolog n=1 Tax=Teleopsis dalmanni TaxID=139649 RepID=UPI0018CECA77|nr:DNA repair protein complementing XP-C cells homolog [Teleopsis dalmanni]